MKEPPLLVSIAILNYNGIHHLRTFLTNILSTLDSRARISVIDNGSTDDSLEYLKEFGGKIDVIKLDQNYGFAEGYNKGLSQIEAKYYLLLNSDVEVNDDFLSPLVKVLEDSPHTAIVQPSILSYANRSFYEYAGASGGFLDIFRYPFCRGRIFNTVEKYSPQYADREIFWASGACMLIRSEVFHDLNGFAGYYFAHMEEIDLCWRAQRLGYAIRVSTGSVVYHLGGGTLSYLSPKKTYLNFRNSLFTLWRNEKLYNLIWLLPVRFTLDIIALFMFVSKGENGNAHAIITARKDYYKRIKVLLKERRLIKKTIKEKHKFNKPVRGIINVSIVMSYYVLGKKNYKNIVGND